MYALPKDNDVALVGAIAKAPEESTLLTKAVLNWLVDKIPKLHTPLFPGLIFAVELPTSKELDIEFVKPNPITKA